jgi:hypothetical protein
VVVSIAKDLLPVVPVLDDVVRLVWNDKTRKPGHGAENKNTIG